MDFEPSRHLSNQRWIVRHRPFLHCHVKQLFSNEIHASLAAAFNQKRDEAGHLNRPTRNYDAVIKCLRSEDADAFFPMLDKRFLELLARTLGLTVVFEIDAAIHAHPAGSRSGWLHNDFNPGWFHRPANPGELIFSESGEVKYKFAGSNPAPGAVERMRYLTMIYYLNNADWVESNGGETGLYSYSFQDVMQPDHAVPPENNSMLIFECTPHSFHSFMKSAVTRSSITLWLHRPIEQMKSEWPLHEPVRWK